MLDYVIRARGFDRFDVKELRPAGESGRAGEIKVEEIRNLLHWLHLSSAGGGRLAVIYESQRLNQSSGNILLKTLEEPPRGAMFILVARTEAVLVTIRSRCRLIRVTGEEDCTGEDERRIEMILNLNNSEAFREVEKIAKDNQVDRFLDQLEAFLRTRLCRTPQVHLVWAIREVERARRVIGGNANMRLVLENLLLSIRH